MEWYRVEFFAVGDEASSIYFVAADNDWDAVLQFAKLYKLKNIVSIVYVRKVEVV